MNLHEILSAINAYADAQRNVPTTRDWLALTHRSSTGAEADAARAIRDAGRDALDEIQDWPTIEQRQDGAAVLQAPDGTRVLYYCERDRQEGRTFERLTLEV